MAMTLLPRFLVLKSGGKYLTIPENLQQGLPSGLLKFDEEQILSPRVKFAVEQAETGDGRFVHIRSCYNNKYWVAHRIKQLLWIVAAGDKPEEDQSRDSCTLFEPLTNSGDGTVRLRHVKTGIPLIDKPPTHPCIEQWMRHAVELYSASCGTLLNVIDWETLVILPSRHISFRTTFAELDGNYVYSHIADQRPYQFLDDSGVKVGDRRVAKDLFRTPDGNYRIKDLCFGKFWKRNDDNIWADGEDNDNSNDTIFSIVKISDNVIALRNLGNNNFCGAFNNCCLNVQYPTMTSETRLMVEERVLQRQISDVRYRLSDSRIYQEEIQEVEHALATNDSPEHESSVTLTYSPSDSRTTHWTNSVSITFGVSVAFTTDIIPLIADGKVEESTEVGNSYNWGVSQTTERTREASYVVVVPPLRKIKVTLMCKKANYDVPFSYVQHDLLTTGERVTTPKDDGLFTGHNSYNFHFKSEVVTEDA